ncbi:MAG: carbon monoxide dehydrogenase [Firmicutes bacterium]|nr:carbon monoxide dehydrogenase [Bacillota bacterium]
MKIAITGKGGVGKTTFSAILSRLYADEGFRVLAVDADPDANLALALGFPKEVMEKIVPISEMKDLVAKRTGSTPGSFGKMFKMNPKVDDIPERYCTEYNNVKLLTMGTVDTGGSGCVCPEHVILKRLTSHLILNNNDVVIMDMEAGIEHLGRGTAEGVDAFIVVVEPGARSLQTFEKVKKLGKDINIDNVYVVGNKIRSKKDEDYIKDKVGKENCLGFIHFSESIMDSDRAGNSPYNSKDAIEEINIIKTKI